MDDEYDNMELVNDGKGVAKLEVNHLDKAFRNFYSLDDLEDVDE